MASEKSAAFNKALRTNIDKITIAVLLLILAGMGWYYWQEQNNSLGTESLAGRPAQLDNALGQNPALRQLQNMAPTPNIENSTASARLARLNMFDYASVGPKRQLEQELTGLVAQAEQLIAAGQTEQARPLLQRVTAEMASNIRAHQLLEQITTPTAAATPAPDPAAPVL